MEPDYKPGWQMSKDILEHKMPMDRGLPRGVSLCVNDMRHFGDRGNRKS
jgi:hypothetical protein